jgi:hypothetical protein
MRLVQLVLYLLVLLIAYRTVYEITQRRRVALIVALLIAIPTMLATIYTAIPFGGHNETLIFSSLVYLFGWRVTVRRSEDYRDWAALGLFMGLGWWTFGGIATPIGVVGLLGLRYFSLSRWRLYLLAAALFLIGSFPWWLYNFNHDWVAANVLFSGEFPEGFEPLPIWKKVVAYLFLGLPSLYGLRLPWEPNIQLSLLAGTVILIYWLLVTEAIARAWVYWRNRPSLSLPMELKAIHWVWLCVVVISLIFVLSPFEDVSGRYFLPIWIPATTGLALGLLGLGKWEKSLPALALSLMLAFQGMVVLKAVHSDTGIEYQEETQFRVPERQDQALMDFLEAEGYTRGYASYWTSFRIMYLSGEKIILDTSLPHDKRGYTTGQNRYPAYVDMVAEAEKVVWITQANPKLDRTIESLLGLRGITYQIRDIGTYRVYYNFSERVSPVEFGLNVPSTAHAAMEQYGGAP